TDVYALGVILYEILAGRLPFEVVETPSLFEGLSADPAQCMAELSRRKVARLLHKVQTEPPTPLRRVHLQVPMPLEKVCLKALEKKKEDRYQRAKELAMEVERWLADEPVAAWREPWRVKARRWVGRHRTLVTGFAAALLVGLTISLVFSGF